MGEFFQRTIEATDGEYISVSRVRTWYTCPQKYYYRYVLKAPQEATASALILGKAGHEAIEQQYLAIKRGKGLKESEVLGAAADAWEKHLGDAYNESDKIAYPNKPGLDSAGACKDKLVGMIKHWFNHATMPDEVHAVEQSFRASITDPKTGEVLKTQIVGIIDAMTTRKGEVALEEHKTAGRRWSDEDFRKDLQAAAYLGCTDEAGYMIFNIITKAKTPVLQQQVVVRSDREKRRSALKLSAVMKSIKAGDYYMKEDWPCKSCAYNKRCNDE